MNKNDIPEKSTQKFEGTVLNDTKEPTSLESWDFKKRFHKPHSHYDPSRFDSCASHEFHNEDLRERALCDTYLVNLDSLNEINVPSLFDNLQWTPLLHIRKPVYPGLVREFYANMRLIDGTIHSYVKKIHISLDAGIIGMALGYKEEGPRAYMSKKWDSRVGITYQMALNHTCEGISKMKPTLKELGPDKTILLYKIISHVLIPQSGPRHRITVADFLVLFALITSSQISFAYLMIRHMWKSVKSSKRPDLPYGMFLTCIFEYFKIDTTNEDVENKVSLIEGERDDNQNTDSASGVQSI